MSAIRGVNITSKHSTGGTGKVGGLAGRSSLSTKELDDIVETIALSSREIWVRDYIIKMVRRKHDKHST